jgi:hypothetical protein
MELVFPGSHTGSLFCAREVPEVTATPGMSSEAGLDTRRSYTWPAARCRGSAVVDDSQQM